MDPRKVVLGASQRELVYSWMTEVLDRFAWFTFRDPRDLDAVARAWRNTEADNWFKDYQEALKKHRT